MKTIILDTDIGNDVDDIFALIMLAKMREFKLLGVTTVYGDTKQEAQMTRYILDKLGRIDVPVFPGESSPIKGGAILRGTHITGGFPQDLTNVQVNPHVGAVDFLIEQSKLYEGELEILAIGPLTNIASAILKDPGFSKRVKKITIMGGLIVPEKNPVWLEIIRNHNGEYNISCDLEGSRIVFESDLAIMLIPLDVTTKVAFEKRHLDYFKRMPFGLGDILAKELEIWWLVISQMDDIEDYRSNPHDPMSVVALYDEDFFTIEQGDIVIGHSHGMSGMTIFNKSKKGTTRVALDVKNSVLDEITRRIIQ